MQRSANLLTLHSTLKDMDAIVLKIQNLREGDFESTEARFMVISIQCLTNHLACLSEAITDMIQDELLILIHECDVKSVQAGLKDLDEQFSLKPTEE